VARERAEELVRLTADLYGAGIERILDIAFDAGQLNDEVLAALAADELVANLLIVHGLHPYGVELRVEQALESVRPYLGSHGGDVELLDVTDAGVVRLRLLGSCNGCASSSVTLKLAVEGAIWRGFSWNEMLLPVSILLAVGTLAFLVGARALRRTEA